MLGDPSRIREELGWTPRVPIEQTVDDLLAYWRSVIAAA
jgi:nucleoside-diphosphate-sugar epimerase